jgi:hypothetical protein
MLWPLRILTFTSGTLCTSPVNLTLFRPLSGIRPDDHTRHPVGQLMITAIRRSSKQLREFRTLLEAFQSFWMPEKHCEVTMSRNHKQHSVRGTGSCKNTLGRMVQHFFPSQRNVNTVLTQCSLMVVRQFIWLILVEESHSNLRWITTYLDWGLSQSVLMRHHMKLARHYEKSLCIASLPVSPTFIKSEPPVPIELNCMGLIATLHGNESRESNPVTQPLLTKAFLYAIAQAVSSPDSYRGGPSSSPSQVMWDLRWTKWHWGRVSPSTSVSPAISHSTDCSTFIIIYHPGLVQ